MSGINITMKDLPDSEKPYEKLEKYGEDKLSDAELLAILLKTGTRKETVVEMSKRLLSTNKNKKGLSVLFDKSLNELQEIKGIGRVKSIQIRAVVELSKRLNKQKNICKFKINSPQSIASVYMEEMRREKQEVCKVVLLDKKHQIIYDKNISRGNAESSIVDPRDVFKFAIDKRAYGIVILHNHPSGNPNPSEDDKRITRRLEESSKILGINFVDHIVIGDGTYISFRENRII